MQAAMAIHQQRILVEIAEARSNPMLAYLDATGYPGGRVRVTGRARIG